LKKTTILLILLFLTTNIYAKKTTVIEVDELEAYMQKNVIIIDIRDEKQWKKTGIIPTSYRLTYNGLSKQFNKKRWEYILVRLLKEKSRAFVLISKDGKESKKLANKLFDSKKFVNVMYLKNGMKSWLDADRKVINY